jgi:hypothetical protein
MCIKLLHTSAEVGRDPTMGGQKADTALDRQRGTEVFNRACLRKTGGTHLDAARPSDSGSLFVAGLTVVNSHRRSDIATRNEQKLVAKAPKRSFKIRG